jgi:protein deglycase
MATTEKQVLVLLAEGCEEIEAVTIIDLLRRAKITVVAAGLQAGTVAASRGVKLVPDMTLDEAMADSYDMVVLPGGAGGAERLDEDPRVRTLLQSMAVDGKYVAAICAAPKVLVSAGLLDGRQATSYPGFIDRQPGTDMRYLEDPVVCDGNIITSRGPGTAMDFGLKLIELLRGPGARTQVEDGLQRPAA